MQMEGSYVTIVVITGLVVVFLGLIILIGFVYFLGQIFQRIQSSKSKKSAKPEPQKTDVNNPSAVVPLLKTEDGISDEVVAVISAAIACMSPDYKVTGIKKAKSKASRSTAWGSRGLSENTSVF